MFYKILTKLNFEQHIIICISIRCILIAYGEVQDSLSEVQYTDIDYKVVTDGARYILNNESPFRRHTYRYSPILALCLIPNLLIHKSFGKILFSICDILVGILIKKIVYNELKVTVTEVATSVLKKKRTYNKSKILNLPILEKYENWANCAAYLWLYNPLAMVISTRGNGDSISSMLVLLTIYLIQLPNSKIYHYFLAGLVHGLAIHLRIYPIIFSLAFYLNLSDQSFSNFLSIIPAIFSPNKKQFLLAAGTNLSLLCFTYIFYVQYGLEYISEAYFYHFVRSDTRHNFSLYFLMQYLNANLRTTFVGKCLIHLPKLLLILYLSITFGIYRKTLSFCIFAQTFLIVTYNSVVTSQYFVWYLALLPLCIKNFRKISLKLGLAYFCLWLFGQAIWLLPAYLLEFKGWNTFNLIGVQGMAFFLINIYIIQRLVYNFDVLAEVT